MILAYFIEKGKKEYYFGSVKLYWVEIKRGILYNYLILARQIKEIPMNNNITTNNKKPYSIDNLAMKSQELSLEILKDTLEEIDSIIMKHPERKKQFYVKGKYQRTIVTLYGTVTFKRRLYIDKKTKEYVSLLDKLIGIDQYSRISDEAKIAICDAVLDCKSYRIAGMYAISGTIVSRQTVYNCLRKVEFVRAKPKEKIDINCIHIAIDGFFANYKEFDRKIETKFANIYTGIENVTPKRKKLINKVVMNQTNAINFSKKLIETLNENYNITDSTKLYICGDGANWIKNLCADIPNSIFVIDKFHYKRTLRSLPNPSDAIKAVQTQNIDLLVNQYPLCTSDLQVSNLQYVIANFEYTKYWDEDDFICCAAENVVSHVYNNRIRSIPRNWSINLYKVCIGLALKATNSLSIELPKYENPVNTTNKIDDLFTYFSFERYKEQIPLFNYKKTRTAVIIKDLIYKV